MRARLTLICRACYPYAQLPNKQAMEEHQEIYHGEKPSSESVFTGQVQDNMEFVPHLAQTPWGRELR